MLLWLLSQCKPLDGVNVDLEKGFLLEQYKELRRQVTWHADLGNKLQHLAATGTIATYAWVLTHKEPPKAAWLLPVVIVLLAGIKAGLQIWHTKRVGAKLREIEREFTEKGWEIILGKGIDRPLVGFWLWGLLVILTTFIAFTALTGRPVWFADLLH